MATYTGYTEYSNNMSGGFDASDSRVQSSEGADVTNRTTSLTPVTIKQIQESKQLVQDGPFVLHGQELNHVCFVGVVRNIADHTSNIYLTIEDGTGQIEVRKWSDDSNDITGSQEDADSKPEGSQIAQQYTVGRYVKVYGALKEFGGKKNVQYAVIKNIISFNEVITHHLETIKCHAIATGKLKNAGTAIEASETSEKSLFVQDNTATGGSGDTLNQVLTFCQQKCQGQDANNFAIPIALISQSLNISEESARKCCATLMDQGYIYPTLDDDHYFAL